MLKAALDYDRGTIVIRGIAHMPFAVLDPRTGVLRAQAMHYQSIVDYLKRSGIACEDNVAPGVLPRPNLGEPSTLQQLRDYQQKALDSWAAAGMKGCVVLPTGSGKTLVGVEAIRRAGAAALVVVPTLDLMDQWTGVLARHFPNAKIGNLGGGADSIGPVTVSTYDSAYLRVSSLGNMFALVVFDEVHHLAAPGYRTIAEQMTAPFRLGLTATIEREDELHRDLPALVGGVVFQASPDALAREKHLAPYEIERRKIEMLPEELVQYRQVMQRYHECINSLFGANYSAISIEKLVMMSGRSPLAREALLARNRAANIALNSRAKLDELQEILAENSGTKTIIFTQHNSMVYDISGRFLIPFITHKTGKEERQDVLQGFKEGRYTAIVTSKVLDEGVDVPDAELGIIVSGTGSAREFIQRLGRLLRPGKGGQKKARLIELVSAETREETVTSAKRKRALQKARRQTEKEQQQQQQEART
ncbi:DEAD/DEAH box helicase family protein [Nitrososphaera sp.]|uniref:DEAD/DEAH box helicase family protein n=1 Tax=Nitrososphaera sp. TaxID=1971748 RepID=UPI00307E4FA7